MASASRDDYIHNNLTPSSPSDETTCPICSEDWKPQTMEIVTTHCGHVFHKDCVIAWLESEFAGSSNTCPSCRSVFFESSSDGDDEEDSEDDEDDYDAPIAAIGLIFRETFSVILQADALRQRFGIDLTDVSKPDRFRQALEATVEYAGDAGLPLMEHPEMTPAGVQVIKASATRGLLANEIIRVNEHLMTPDDWVEMLGQLSACREQASDPANFADTQHVDTLVRAVDYMWMACVKPDPCYTLRLSERRPGACLTSVLWAISSNNHPVQRGNLEYRGEQINLFDDGLVQNYLHFQVEVAVQHDGHNPVLRITELQPGSVSRLMVAEGMARVDILTNDGPVVEVTPVFADGPFGLGP
ncbi:hypothetical protein BU26DRAFT_565698 [Trematosphaeria pertusa]|uniref:RING-type domain-containing protein n=1 Tax=Trematosphaeria pertusa TaxID=390896 RepID=A0A6A6ICJ2_9PLEO|nr:uncharacterized protein BU26DRAFT_565698 [Trematosphaeria pertusa]KAF2248295.1 hypothetical protein BU26DRAFT_565698 [Trematosphaeria pertusa]